MNKITEFFNTWFFPDEDKETKIEIDTLNIKTTRSLSLIVGIVQTISLITYIIVHHMDFADPQIVGAATRVGLSVILCLLGFFTSQWLIKRPEVMRERSDIVHFFIGSFVILMIAWGIYVSINNYTHHQQLLTFYTVELLAVLLIKLHPMFTATIITASYLINYLILNFGYEEGLINPYNYAMLAVLSIAGGVINHRMTVNYISEKNKANMLNSALEIIANHDSLTRLQNRYALNQNVPDYIDRDVCMAMGDVNRFKIINDTYGHRTGDDVLKAFADILLEFFPQESVYRYGGDEFFIIEYGNDFHAFSEKLKRVNERFENIEITNIEKGLNCSFGSLKAHPKDISDFFKQLTAADQMLYSEKEKFRAKQ